MDNRYRDVRIPTGKANCDFERLVTERHVDGDWRTAGAAETKELDSYEILTEGSSNTDEIPKVVGVYGIRMRKTSALIASMEAMWK